MKSACLDNSEALNNERYKIHVRIDGGTEQGRPKSAFSPTWRLEL